MIFPQSLANMKLEKGDLDRLRNFAGSKKIPSKSERFLNSILNLIEVLLTIVFQL